MTTVFLGGTCNDSTWRDELINKLDSTRVDAFNPVVDDWNEAAQINEDMHKEQDDICLYCLTPEMTGSYSIFELGLDIGRRPERTVFCFLEERAGETFTATQTKGFVKMQKDVILAGGQAYNNLDDVATFLNTYEKAKQKRKEG